MGKKLPTPRSPEIKAALKEYGRMAKRAISPEDQIELIRLREEVYKKAGVIPEEKTCEVTEEDKFLADLLGKLNVEIGDPIDEEVVDEEVEEEVVSPSPAKRARGPQIGGGVFDVLKSARTAILRALGRCGRRVAGSANEAATFAVAALDRVEGDKMRAAAAAAGVAEAAAGPDALNNALVQEGASMAQQLVLATTSAALLGAFDRVYPMLMPNLMQMAWGAAIGTPDFVASIGMRAAGLGALGATGAALASIMLLKMAFLSKVTGTVVDVAAAGAGAVAAAPAAAGQVAVISGSVLKDLSLVGFVATGRQLGLDRYKQSFDIAIRALRDTIDEANAVMDGAAGAAAPVGGIQRVQDWMQGMAGAPPAAAQGLMQRAGPLVGWGAIAMDRVATVVLDAEDWAIQGARATIGNMIALMSTLNPGPVISQAIMDQALQLLRNAGMVERIAGQLQQQIPQLQAAAPAAAAGNAPAAAAAAAAAPPLPPADAAAAAAAIGDAAAAAAAMLALAEGEAAPVAEGEAAPVVEDAEGGAGGDESDGLGRLGVEAMREAVRQPPMGGQRCHSCGNVFGKTRRAARGKKSKKSGKTAKKGGKKAVRKGSFRKGRKHSKKQRR